MLERLEGIVKVRDQQKFNVRSGREYLIAGVFILLVFSFAQVRATIPRDPSATPPFACPLPSPSSPPLRAVDVGDD